MAPNRESSALLASVLAVLSLLVQVWSLTIGPIHQARVESRRNHAEMDRIACQTGQERMARLANSVHDSATAEAHKESFELYLLEQLPRLENPTLNALFVSVRDSVAMETAQQDSFNAGDEVEIRAYARLKKFIGDQAVATARECNKIAS
jgi:hypothetical protein